MNLPMAVPCDARLGCHCARVCCALLLPWSNHMGGMGGRASLHSSWHLDRRACTGAQVKRLLSFEWVQPRSGSVQACRCIETAFSLIAAACHAFRGQCVALLCVGVQDANLISAFLLGALISAYWRHQLTVTTVSFARSCAAAPSACCAQLFLLAVSHVLMSIAATQRGQHHRMHRAR